ncbi:hypothetical protein [Pseudonocardia nigra]|uniref:hypothetical protein n=1 Tax=Pseudonocardia nigra TaxID=1921578 RepID=UPI001C60268C|nr:hypothetical protein [Pseudonocardia nigra]
MSTTFAAPAARVPRVVPVLALSVFALGTRPRLAGYERGLRAQMAPGRVVGKARVSPEA